MTRWDAALEIAAVLGICYAVVAALMWGLSWLNRVGSKTVDAGNLWMAIWHATAALWMIAGPVATWEAVGAIIAPVTGVWHAVAVLVLPAAIFAAVEMLRRRPA